MHNSVGCFMSLCICVSWGMFVGSSRTLPHVISYKAVRTQKLHAQFRRSFSSQKSYPEEVRYSLMIEGQNYTLHLERNRYLIGKHYTLTDYKKDGVTKTSPTHHEEHCYYHGHIEDVEDSSVSLSLCSGMRGFVRAEEQVFLIEPLEGTEDEGLVAVYRQEHLRRKRSSCSHGNDTVHDHSPSGLFQHSSLRQRGQPGVQRVVEMVLVVDNSEYKKLGSKESAEARMLEVANHVDKVYRPLGIRVMLVGLELWSYRDQVVIRESPDETLTSFLQWRQDNLLQRTAHDNAQLVTAVDFLGTTVGLATSSAMCTPKSGGVNQDHSANPVGVASTIAHEMGHNLGMAHDDASLCRCSAGASVRGCIMAESIGLHYPSMFSSCSVQQLSRFLEEVNPPCLLDTPPVDRIYGGRHCGNAFLEPGEECDCGTVKDCSNPCCNASTCRLNRWAQCAHGDCCDNCQLRQVGAVCRPIAGECDLTEHCSGLTPNCPPDAHTLNGRPCDNGDGYCYNGQCPSHRQHCKRLWGPDAEVAAISCFHQNVRGGQCGTLYGLQACSSQDMMCGKLFCLGGQVFPVTGGKSVITLSQGVTCNVATSDPRAQSEDLGNVPTGTKCGNNMVCHDQRCQDIKVYGPQDCAAKCHNRGVCNHERQCHCDPGWAPPYCDMKLMELAGINGVVISVSLVVVSLLLTSLFIGSLLYCRKHRQRNSLSKPPISSTSGQSNPLFQPSSFPVSPRSGSLHISLPKFVGSTATQRCKPLPQPPPHTASQVFQPLNVSLLPSSATRIVKPTMPPPVAPSKAAHLVAKPQPPSRPLPPLRYKEVTKVNSQVLPKKPTLIQSSWKQRQLSSSRPDIALKPPADPDNNI